MKLKTDQTAQKRFKKTATGILKRRPAAISHLRRNKSPRKKGSLSISNTNLDRLRKMLPGIKGVR